VENLSNKTYKVSAAKQRRDKWGKTYKVFATQQRRAATL